MDKKENTLKSDFVIDTRILLAEMNRQYARGLLYIFCKLWFKWLLSFVRMTVYPFPFFKSKSLCEISAKAWSGLFSLPGLVNYSSQDLLRNSKEMNH